MDIQKLKEKYSGIAKEFETLPSPILANLNFVMMCEILDKLEQITPTPEVEEEKATTKKATTKK